LSLRAEKIGRSGHALKKWFTPSVKKAKQASVLRKKERAGPPKEETLGPRFPRFEKGGAAKGGKGMEKARAFSLVRRKKT
jgi:hypothetical protein